MEIWAYLGCFLLGAAVLAAGLMLERQSIQRRSGKEKKSNGEKMPDAVSGERKRMELEKELLNFLNYDGTEQE